MDLAKEYTFTTVALPHSKNVAVISQNGEHQFRIGIDKFLARCLNYIARKMAYLSGIEPSSSTCISATSTRNRNECTRHGIQFPRRALPRYIKLNNHTGRGRLEPKNCGWIWMKNRKEMEKKRGSEHGEEMKNKGACATSAFCPSGASTTSNRLTTTKKIQPRTKTARKTSSITKILQPPQYLFLPPRFFLKSKHPIF